MEVAIREARQWAGYHESKSESDSAIKKKRGSKGVITDNYHKNVGVVIDNKTPTLSTAWCASFANYCLKDSGNSYLKSASSQFPVKSKKFIKIAAPIYGALVVYKQNNNTGKGHVAFMLSKIESEDYAVLGGNQGQSITLNPHKKVYLDSLGFLLVGYYVPLEYNRAAQDILKKGGDLNEVRSMTALKKYIGDKSGNESQTR
jgi:uncharacterized protein (TIGR02594 family)